MRTALGPFLRLWSAQTFSALGSSMTSFALVIWAYEQSGSALSTALLAFGAMYAVIAFDLTTFVVAFLTLLFGIRMVYDFFLPGLLLDALERRSGEVLVQWIREICDRKMLTVNMLGCHDGIPLLDLKGLLPEERIQSLIDTVVSRGGYVKDLHGAKNVYYQVNATYYSALGEDDKKMLLARAIQLFMPGKPQVWYLDLFAGRNDHAAVQRAGAGGHKEINRTNLTCSDIAAGMKKPIVQKQIELLRMRNQFSVFSANAKIVAEMNGTKMDIRWQSGSEEAALQTDFGDYSFSVSIRDTSSDTEYFKYDS